MGVQIRGNDHFLTDVIVFEFTHIGVEVDGAANLLQGVHTWNAAVYRGNGYSWKGGVGIAINAAQNRLIGCYLDYSSLEVTNPTTLVVEATFFLATPAVFVATNGRTTINGVSMHGNTYNVGGASIRLDPAFVDGSQCSIDEDTTPSALVTRASRTVAHLDAPVTNFTLSFPELLLPRIEEVEYSFVAASAAEPWVQHRALVVNKTVVVQASQAVRGTVTARVAQAVHGMPRPPGHWVNAASGLCLDTDGHFVDNGNPVNVWSCVASAPNESFLPDAAGHLVGQNSLKCLSTDNCGAGAGACIQPCEAGRDMWDLGAADASGRQTIRPGNNTTACLQADAGLSGKVYVDACSKPPAPAQLWRRV